ncbi:MAG: cytochrome oxidase [Mesorhizobium amorphae]|nr:MAG: cytochrome oxidase [Mesorhizobium amorphae]
MTILPHDARAAGGRPFTGWHMLGVVGLFFGTIIAVNCVMAFFAVSTFPGLNAKNSYVASQNYNILLRDAAAQEARGWRGGLVLDAGRLVLALEDRDGTPIHGLTVRALAGRPATAASDRLLDLFPAPEGYRAADPLPSGRWLVEIEAREGETLVWRRTQPLVVP